MGEGRDGERMMMWKPENQSVHGWAAWAPFKVTLFSLDLSWLHIWVSHSLPGVTAGGGHDTGNVLSV